MRSQRNKRKSIAVSQLAQFAANKEKFIKYRGGVVSQKAVDYGNTHHDALGAPDIKKSNELNSIIFFICSSSNLMRQC